MSFLIKGHLDLQSVDRKKIQPGEMIVKFYDRDPDDDDFLGSAIPDASGDVQLEIKPEDFSQDGFLNKENYPDIYFKVVYGGLDIYRSKVYTNIHWKIRPGDKEPHIVYDLGTVEV
jgi:hypothetical protein